MYLNTNIKCLKLRNETFLINSQKKNKGHKDNDKSV